MQQQTHAAQLRSELPDLNQVVSPENEARLREEHPEIASLIDSAPDLYTAGKAAYKFIKKMGIYNEAPPVDRDWETT